MCVCENTVSNVLMRTCASIVLAARSLTKNIYHATRRMKVVTQGPLWILSSLVPSVLFSRIRYYLTNLGGLLRLLWGRRALRGTSS
jgi:hypothetical protein